MAERLRGRSVERDSRVTVVGPAPAYIARRADRWRWNIVLRGDDPVGLLDGGLDAPWSVDVDPESLALDGSTLSWQKAGVTQSATLN